MYRESNNIIETINIPLVVPAKTGIYQTFLSWKIPEIRFIDSAGSRLSTGSSSHFSCTGVPACTFCHSLSPLSFPRKRESWARRRNTFRRCSSEGWCTTLSRNAVDLSRRYFTKWTYISNQPCLLYHPRNTIHGFSHPSCWKLFPYLIGERDPETPPQSFCIY